MHCGRMQNHNTSRCTTVFGFGFVIECSKTDDACANRISYRSKQFRKIDCQQTKSTCDGIKFNILIRKNIFEIVCRGSQKKYQKEKRTADWI